MGKEENAGGGKPSAEDIKKILEAGYKLYNEAEKRALDEKAFKDSIRSMGSSLVQGDLNNKRFEEIVIAFGMNFEEARKNYYTFSSLALHSDAEGYQANDLFAGLSRGALGMRLGEEETKTMFIALGDMINKGRLTPENLNALSPKLQADLALSLNKSFEELNLLAEGKDGKTQDGIEAVKKLSDRIASQNSTEFRDYVHGIDASNNRMDAAKNGFASNSQLTYGDINSIAQPKNGIAKLSYHHNYQSDINSFIRDGIAQFGVGPGGDVTRFKLLSGRMDSEDVLSDLYSVAQRVTNSMENASKNPAAVSNEIKNLLALGEKMRKERAVVLSDPNMSKGRYDILQAEYGYIQATITKGISSIHDLSVGRYKRAEENRILRRKAPQATVTNASAPKKKPAKPSCDCCTTININKLADITIQTTNVIEGAGEIKEIITKELLEVLNDANQLCD